MANKETQKAINQIDVFINELNSINSKESGNIWQGKVYDTISLYIPDGDLKKTFKQLTFTQFQSVPYDRHPVSGRVLTKPNYVFDNQKKSQYEQSLNNIKDYINIKGVLKADNSKTTKSNLVSNLSQLELILLAVSFCGGAFGIGFYFGQDKIDRDFVELKQENKVTLKEKADLQTNLDSIQKVLEKTQIELDFRRQEVEAKTKELWERAAESQKASGKH